MRISPISHVLSERSTSLEAYWCGDPHFFAHLLNYCSVHFLYFLDSAQSILTLADTFFWFVYGFGSPAKLLQFNMASFDVPAIDGLIALVVQTMYCWRIWKLGHWKFVPALALFVSLSSSNPHLQTR